MNQITIALMGDVMLGRLVGEALAKGKSDVFPWGDFLPLLQSVDFRLLNLENALTLSEKKVPKVFNFKTIPEHVAVLKSASIDVVNLANNHILDYGEEGLIDTLETLDKAGIEHVGAGVSFNEAAKGIICEKKGIKIGILGCTDNEPTWLAKEKKPGTHYIRVGDISSLETIIPTLKSMVDLLILSIHWGPNMKLRPDSTFRKFAKQLIDLGVDIIHGHSAHVFQGIEIYKNKLILYDTGDFIDDYSIDSELRNDLSFLYLIDVMDSEIQTLRLIPNKIQGFRANRAGRLASEFAIDRMITLSKELGTSFDISQGELYVRLA
ncbi:MAG: CapA family protein [Chlamydiales bacterium]